jgi:hypothetical protein
MSEVVIGGDVTWTSRGSTKTGKVIAKLEGSKGSSKHGVSVTDFLKKTQIAFKPSDIKTYEWDEKDRWLVQVPSGKGSLWYTIAVKK